MPTIVELHRRTVTAARTVLDRVTPADLDRPTPCAGWDLRALLEHMTGQDHGFAAALRATLAGTDADLSAFAPRPLGPAPAATLAAGLDDVAAAFAGAAEVERTVLLAEFDRRVPAPVLVAMHQVDTLVHGWDVAAALGIAESYRAELDDEIVAAGLATAERVPADEATRTAPHASFGPALAGGGTDGWTRTLTLLGRDPAWGAPS